MCTNFCFKDSLSLYLEAIEKQKSSTPPELYNNVAILYFHFGHFAKSEYYLRLALGGEASPTVTKQPTSEEVKGLGLKRRVGLVLEKTQWDLEKFLNVGKSSSSSGAPLLDLMLTPAHVTITFNLARLYEEDSRNELAVTLYKVTKERKQIQSEIIRFFFFFPCFSSEH